MHMATLTLGPVYFLWDGPKWRDFYKKIAHEAPIARVVIGETICSKRNHFTAPYMEEVIVHLERAGKEVILSSPALVTLERESRLMRELIGEATRKVEANDLSALHLLAGKPHVIGPLVNVYNAATAKLLAARGAETICLPPELPFSSVEKIAAITGGADYEIFAFGRVPLAISARCAHARAKGAVKDNCRFVCGDEPDGLAVKTLDRQPFLTLNGVQTVSHSCQSLIGEMADLTEAGIARFRLSPQDCDMSAVATLYRAVLDGAMEAGAAAERLEALYPAAPLSNGFHYAREGAAWIAKARTGQHQANS